MFRSFSIGGMSSSSHSCTVQIQPNASRSSSGWETCGPKVLCNGGPDPLTAGAVGEKASLNQSSSGDIICNGHGFVTLVKEAHGVKMADKLFMYYSVNLFMGWEN